VRQPEQALASCKPISVGAQFADVGTTASYKVRRPNTTKAKMP
jgi:hypothetical protein